MTRILLQTKGLTKKYGDQAALDSVSLTLRQGDIYGLIGRNGAGKTTFFKCVMGLAKPSAGSIMIGGTRNKTDNGKKSLNAARQGIGCMISPSFFPYLGPRQNLEYLCRVKGVSGKGEVDRLLEIVGLQGVAKPFRSFSLGMKQRLGIAGALLGSPPVVVLDEPINGLDPQGIADMRAVIQRENSEQGVTFIISSHILSELDLVASTFGFIEQGRLLQEITHTDLHEHTKNSLIIEVGDPAASAVALREGLGIAKQRIEGRCLILESHLDQVPAITRLLVEHGQDVFQIAPQGSTLEDYFMRLIGGGSDA